MNRDVIVESPTYFGGGLERNRRDVLARAQKVDLDQVSLAGENLFLFAEVEFTSLLTRCLVRETQDLDRGDKTFAFGTTGVDFDEGFPEFVVGDLDRDGTRDELGRDGRSAGNCWTR